MKRKVQHWLEQASWNNLTNDQWPLNQQISIPSVLKNGCRRNFPLLFGLALPCQLTIQLHTTTSFPVSASKFLRRIVHSVFPNLRVSIFIRDCRAVCSWIWAVKQSRRVSTYRPASQCRRPYSRRDARYIEKISLGVSNQSWFSRHVPLYSRYFITSLQFKCGSE